RDSDNGLPAMRESLQWIRDRVGPDHPDSLSMEYRYYARLLACEKRGEAEVLLREILTELRGAPPQALDYVSPLLRMASLQPDLDPSAFEDVSQLSHRAIARRRFDPPNAEPLLTELTMLLRQKNETGASALACEQLRTALGASPRRWDEVIPLAWGVAPVRGLSPEAYNLLGECAAAIPKLEPPKNVFAFNQTQYELQLRSLA